MSKFTVLVVGPHGGDAVEAALEPFDTHLKFPEYIKFTREDKAAERKRLVRFWKKQVEENPGDVGIYNKLAEIQKHDDESWFLHCTRFYSPHETNTQGEPITTANPNGKFDTWEPTPIFPVGGMVVSTAKKKHIDWENLESELRVKALTDFVKSNSYTEEQQRLIFDRWKDELPDDYMARKSRFLTHAYIHRGKWYERGRVGWWGKCEGDVVPIDEWLKQYKEMLRSLKDDTTLTHITCRV